MPEASRVRAPDQILTVVAMRSAEAALIAAGSSVEALMQTAGRGAADYVWRMAARRRVTVLTGPGNNGGDGWVIAEALRERGVPVVVVAACEPKTEAARVARDGYGGAVLGPQDAVAGEVLVDCLFGSGLTRPLEARDAALLARLAASHPQRVAIDVPSGVESDTGACLNEGLPTFDMTVALGAWKYAHVLMPAAAKMGGLKLVDIGCRADHGGVEHGVGRMLRRPMLRVPAADAHKYKRGLLAVVAGAMPGAALLAARAAPGAGAGYVKLLAPGVPGGLPADLVLELVLEPRDLAERLEDARLGALLVGPGLGRDEGARDRLKAVLASGVPAVLDADALVLLTPKMLRGRERLPLGLIATPHEGELDALERAFGLAAAKGGAPGSKVERARVLARATGMVIVAKGPDTVIAGPANESGAVVLCAPRASSWLSTAGTGDVLAGCIASRLAGGSAPLAAAGEGVWLHGEAARGLIGPFSAGALAEAVPQAYAAALT